jgi:formylglycine-generating enzyme required for sulfatase activity
VNAASALSAARPFPGLRPFAFADHEFFFGREDQSFELYRRLDRSRFIAVVGSSGSGKSSLVRAGLHPLIAAEAAEDAGRSWRWVEMRPGDAPLANLAAGLADLMPASDDAIADAGRRERFLFTLRQSRFGIGQVLDSMGSLAGGELLLLVDQFEELFRYAAPPARGAGGRAEQAAGREEAIQFVQLLLQAARDPARPVHVLLTMRSDFIGDCARFHGLPEAVSASQFLVPSLTRDQLEAVIRRPIEKAEAAIEPALVERLLNDAGDELDELPVLQHCLQRVWEEAQKTAGRGKRPRLTLAHYNAIGGLAQALSRHADEVLASLPGDELAVEQVFRALSEIDRENRATRRALPFAQLLAETGAEDAALRRVLDRFRAEDCSFLVPPPSAVPVLTDDTRIDVGHEALLRRWDKISAEPEAAVESEARRGGWLWQEQGDGYTYRALLALLQGGRTLPLDQVTARWAWWNERPRTSAWAERYGGRIERVRQLFADSRAAVRRGRVRLAATIAGAAMALPVIAGIVWAGLVWWGVHQVEAELKLVSIAAGCFEMGSPDNEPGRYPNEGPVHKVCVKPFDLGQYDVTQGEWRKVMIFPNTPAPSFFKGDDRLPVEEVNWNEAQRFVWLMSLFGHGHYRLPSESEWEYAARAGTTTSRYWGDNIDDGCAYENIADQSLKRDQPDAVPVFANCDDGYGYTTAPVGSFKPNRWGLHDMLGNVANWVEDCYVDSYSGTPTDGRPNTSGSCTSRVVRGGSWSNGPRLVRAADRDNGAPDNRSDYVGFRLARTITP